jgi:uncharacterized membrane protein YGL010W
MSSGAQGPFANPWANRWFATYTADHRHPMNRVTHKVAIPLIVFHIFAMLDWVKLGGAIDVGGISVVPSLGHVGYVLAVGFYAWLNLPLAAWMAVLFALTFPLAAVTPTALVVTAAVIGWVVQMAGHAVWEKNKPSFASNILQALIGPAFFVAVLTGAYRPAFDAPAEA